MKTTSYKTCTLGYFLLGNTHLSFIHLACHQSLTYWSLCTKLQKPVISVWKDYWSFYVLFSFCLSLFLWYFFYVDYFLLSRIRKTNTIYYNERVKSKREQAGCAKECVYGRRKRTFIQRQTGVSRPETLILAFKLPSTLK